MILRAVRSLTVAALALLVAGPAGAQTSAAIHVATIPIDSGSEAFYAKDAGFFAKSGLDATVESIPNGPAIISGVTGGSIDVGFSNLVSLEAAYKKGVPIVLIAAAGLYIDSAPTTLLMVDKDSTVKTGKDLNDKIIATNGLKNIGQYAPAAWVDQNGGDSTTVKFVEMPFPEMAGALAQHRIDAAIIAEPTLSDAKTTTRVLGKPYSAIGKEYLIGAWFANANWAKAHPDLIAKFVAAMHDTALWANANQAKSAEILAKYATIDPAVAAKMTRAKFAESLTPALVQPTIDITAKYKGMDAPFPAQDMIYQASR
jgi:NitT/TauT family transport system substrate-binding protein